jgi:hypothetical protein
MHTSPRRLLQQDTPLSTLYEASPVPAGSSVGCIVHLAPLTRSARVVPTSYWYSNGLYPTA